ncbi:hypothetical protein JL722_9522 [Aureococcus anophagefferens]|nr:hypothetical protein JL722_9522 [Aureococcus anophagefferens]
MIAGVDHGAFLRALQDKIARLEGERAEAVNSTKEMRHQLREMELKVESHRLDGAEESRLRSAYERLASEAASKDAAMLAAENRARAAEQRLDAARAEEGDVGAAGRAVRRRPGRRRRRRRAAGARAKKRRQAAGRRQDDAEAKPPPWVPSSDGGVSFNLAAACNYALRKTQQPAP